MNVVQAVAAVMADVGHVSKDQRHAQQGFNFRGVDAVINAVGPALRAHGVLVVPKVIKSERVTTTTAKGATMMNAYLTVRYTFHGPEGDTFKATVEAEAFDSGDKATAKAMSVAFRTALIQVLCLPTNESDPDASTYERAPMSIAKPATPEQADTLATLAAELGLTVEREAAAAKWASKGRTGDLYALNHDEAAAAIEAMRKQVKP